MSVISTTPQLVNTSEDPGLEYLNQREIEVALTPTENSTKSVVYEEVTQVITNVFQVNAPSGANGQLQFNQNGQYVGDTELQYDPNTDTLTTGSIIANSITITGNASTFKLPGGNNNDVLKTDGTGNLSWANVFPSVSGNTGKFLVTNGVSIDWSSTSYNSLATTTYVSSAIADLVGTAPAMLNTLAEIANVIGQTNDPQYGIISQLANKANISNLAQVAFSGSYTDLSNLPTISNAGRTGNWADIRNKPTIPTTIMDLGISDGSIGQVLTANGNGTYHFTTVAGGSSYNQDLNTTNNVTFSSVTSSNISSPGNVVINTQNGTFTWNFTSTGALLFPQTPYVTSGIVVNDNNQELSISTDRGNISIWPESSKWLFGANGNLTLPNSGTINDNSGGAGTPGILISRTLHTPDDTDPQNFGEDTITILLDNSEGIQIETYLAQGIGVKVWFNLGNSYSITSCVKVANGTWTITAIGMGDRFSTFETNALIFIYTGSTPNTYTNFPQYVAAGVGATVAITKGNNTWEFGNDGNLTLPAGGDIVDSTGTSVLGGGTGNWNFRNDTIYNLSGGEINNSDTAHGATSGLILPVNGNTTVRTALYNTYGNVQIQVANLANSASTSIWNFGTDGELKLPAGGDIVDSTGNTVLFDGDYTNLTNKPTLFDGAYSSLTGKPTLFDGDYTNLTNKPTLFDGAYSSLTGKPAIPADVSDLTDTTNLLGGSGATNQITNTDGTSTYTLSVGTDGVISMATARGGIEFGAMPEIGGPTHLHIMRPSGQNSSTDLFFGDDFNYVKLPGQYGIDPNYQQGVEIGSSLNEGTVSVWRFDTDGTLTLPNSGKIASGVDVAQVGSTRTIATDSNDGTGAGTPGVVDVAYDNTIIPTYYYPGGGAPNFTDSTITFANGDVRTITSIVATGGYIDISYSGATTTSSPEFPIILKTGNYAAATTAPEWTFGTNGNLTLPGSIKSTSVSQVGQRITCMDVYGSSFNYYLFNSTTFTGGVYSDIQVGWTVSNGDGWTANVTGVDDPNPWMITIDDTWNHVNYKLVSFTSPDYEAATAEDLILTSDASSLTLSANGSLTLPNSGGVIKSTDSSTIINGAYKSFTFATGAWGPGPGYAGNGVGLVITPESEQIKVGWTCTFSNTGTIFTVTDVAYISNTISISFDSLTDNVVFPMVAHSPPSSIKLQPVNGGNTWTFNANGTTTFPGNLVGSGASPAPSISGFDSISALTFTNGTSNVTINSNSNLWKFGTDGNLTIPGSSGGFIKTVSNASIGIAAVDNGTDNPAQLLSINAGSGAATSIVSAYATNATIQTNASGAINTWKFDNAGNLTLPANTFAVNYANGTQVSLGSGSSSNISNGNSNVRIATANGNVTIASAGNTTMTITGTGANITGTTNITGTSVTGVNSILAGPTFTPLSNTMGGFVSNVNNYTQLTIQNKSTGADATTDFIATADNGSDTVNYLDMGIINSGYDALTPTNSLGNIVYAADSYIYAQGNTSAVSQSGGNLAIGTTVAGKTVKIFAGGITASNIVATVANTGVTVNGNVTATKFVGDGSSLTNVTVNVAGNITGTSPNVSLVAGSYTMTFDNTGLLTLPTMGGDEGGEINFGIPATNTTLTARVVTDVFQNRFRIYDGSTKGVYIDLSQAGTGVSTLLNNRVSGLVNAGSFVTMDLIKATVTTSGNRGLSLATTTGTFACNIGGTYSTTTTATGGSAGTLTITTTASSSVFGWGFFNQGDTATYVLTDTTNSRAYRIIVQIGNGFNNNMISIERLI